MKRKIQKKLLILIPVILVLVATGVLVMVTLLNQKTKAPESNEDSSQSAPSDTEDEESETPATEPEDPDSEKPSSGGSGSSSGGSSSGGSSKPSGSGSSGSGSSGSSKPSTKPPTTSKPKPPSTPSVASQLGIPSTSSGARTDYLHYLIVGGETLRSFYGYHNDPVFSETYTVAYIKNELATDKYQYKVVVKGVTRYFVWSDIDRLASTYDALIAANRNDPALNRVVYDGKSFLNLYDTFKGYLRNVAYSQFIPNAHK